MVVSEIGEQWSPQTAPAMQAEIAIIEQFNIQMGEELTVSFDVDARQWNDRWFNSIRAWKVERVGAGAPMAPGAPVPPPAPSATPDFTMGDAKDDLPF